MVHGTGSFAPLTPHLVIAAVEAFFDISLDGTVERYASYVNRVYGLRSTQGEHLVAKFYRPGRWSMDAIEAEHRFLQELAAAEVPVVAPLADEEGDTLFEIEVDPADGDPGDAPTGASDAPAAFTFALFPRRGGRNFDVESDEDWFRLGSIVGRMHVVARRDDAPERLPVDPAGWTGTFVDELLGTGNGRRDLVVHPDCAAEFEEVARRAISAIEPRFSGLPGHRLHGDCHRGNILDRPGEGLLLIDFDDMMMGPAVQDLWLLLPDHADDSRRELTMLLDGYEQFSVFDRGQIELIEPLRFMRMIHFLAWRARQRHDHWFAEQFPHWGSKAFWITEIEDLSEQSRHFL